MNKALKNKKVLITAGPTREYIDPVRYISNDSSGKMGYALAEAATNMGARVTLISGPTNLERPKCSKFIPVINAREMYKAALAESKRADIIICAAAVADFRPKRISKRKIKKPEIRVELTKNPDILKSLGGRKRKNQLLVGFALETEDMVRNARKKMLDKGCDFIIANKHTNIGSNTGALVLLDQTGRKTPFKRQTKKNLASKILKSISMPNNSSKTA